MAVLPLEPAPRAASMAQGARLKASCHTWHPVWAEPAERGPVLARSAVPSLAVSVGLCLFTGMALQAQGSDWSQARTEDHLPGQGLASSSCPVPTLPSEAASPSPRAHVLHSWDTAEGGHFHSESSGRLGHLGRLGRPGRD